MSRRDARIDNDRDVRAAAKTLGIRAKTNLRDEIVRAAERQVETWIDELGEHPKTLDEVHRLVLNFCGVRVERIDEDSDIKRVESTYEENVLPIQLEFEFSRDTEALVFKNPSTDGRSASRFIAVVDARGERRTRSWFAERHEPSHVLCGDKRMITVFRRTQTVRPEPLEQVVDAVAASVGFWKPIVLPVLRRQLECMNVLDAFDRTRSIVALGASVEASYRAFARLCEFPVVLVRSSLATRKGDRSGRSLALRATTVVHNAAAETVGMRIPQNYRISPGSVIQRAHSNFGTLSADDDLGYWKDSTGRTLEPCRVHVIARDAWAAVTSR